MENNLTAKPATEESLDSGAVSAPPTASLSEDQNLSATLLLLAERARFLTSASGVAIAFGEGNSLICRASAGTDMPLKGSPLALESGPASELMAECVNKRLPVICCDINSDSRVDADLCREQGIGSILIAPLVFENEAVGILQFFSPRESAFTDSDVQEAKRIADLILTSIEEPEDLAEEANQSSDQTASPSALSRIRIKNGRVSIPASSVPEALPGAPGPLARSESPKLCTRCGFPVSAGRTICVDCEAADFASGVSSDPTPSSEFGHLADLPRQSWLHEHFYTIGIVVVSVLTLVVLSIWAR